MKTTRDIVKELQNCYGGFWRYPEVVDYYYLVNPYFPPTELADEFKKEFFNLLIQYPSGMRVNSELAARNFGVDASMIVVGNGASELISSLMKTVKGKAGFAYPSFEEYPNRLPVARRVPFYVKDKDFRYTVDDIIEFYGAQENHVEALTIVNPDNPSGNIIPRQDMLRLIGWAESCGVRLFIDESFIDFADEPYTLIDSGLLAEHPNLSVVKSISKAYGVPGLRLGVLASGDEEMVSWMKKDVAIWNINSFAEFYMQIAPKYTEQFKTAYSKFKQERNRFFAALQKYEFLRVLPTQANYFLAEVLPPYTTVELACRLYESQKVLVKDCSTKKAFEGKQYIRITIRTEEDNNRFLSGLEALKQ